MKKNYILKNLVLFSLFFLYQVAIALAPIEKAPYALYLHLLSSHEGLSSEQRDMLKKSLENHDLNGKQILKDALKKEDRQTYLSKFNKDYEGFSQRSHCQEEELARAYESFFSSTFLEKRDQLPDEFKQLLKKLYRSTFNQEENKRKACVVTWLNTPLDNLPVKYFVSQKKEGETDKMIKTIKDISLFYDFFAYYSFFHLDESVKAKKVGCYGSINEMRGERTRRPITIPNVPQYGITQNELPELASPFLVKGWEHPHWRDSIDPQTSIYVRAAMEQRLPIACGVSGHTNLHLWGLSTLQNQVPLQEKELRLYLLGLWATLTGDGGHTLAEILSATSVVSNYPKGKLDSPLKEALDSFSSNINPELNNVGRYYDLFFRYFKEGDGQNSVWVNELRDEVWNRFINYFNKYCLDHRDRQ